MLSLDTATGVKKAVELLDQAEIITDQILAARRMVTRRARLLNCSSMIPTEWRKTPVAASGAEVESPEHERRPRLQRASQRCGIIAPRGGELGHAEYLQHSDLHDHIRQPCSRRCHVHHLQ